MRSYGTAVGSGAIISNNLILTNAHVISDATFIQVQKENDPVNYEAEVLYAAHDCDLALLKVKDSTFFKGTVSLEFGEIPDLKSVVATYGYPLGGERISITEGVVSRIEIGLYAHSKKIALLMIQTDAAINSGNSGGPVMQEGRVVGIAFQAITDSSNIGYMIPTPIIIHFLDDIQDGQYDGFSDLGILTENLLNPAYREFLGMDENLTGIIITHVMPKSSAWNKLKKNDVILSIDRKKIANDGSIAYGDSRILFSIIADQKQVGDTVTLEILRDKRVISVPVILKQISARIPWYEEYETLPDYYIFGGIIFQPLNREFLKCWDKWWFKADRRMLYNFFYAERDIIHPERSEFIIINHVLPDPENSYVSDMHDLVVNRINNTKITKLKDVIEAFRNPLGQYHVIEVEGYNKPVLIKASGMESANKRILKKYEIPSDRRSGDK
ncbi:MAG: trypsin-like peptidase domain-containing protein [Spirochaetes bacterium]|nr:trypsin-like peptidase domain-containing protein [Spirochaetota bacterium]